VQNSLAQNLAAVAARMEPKDAPQAMAQTTDPDALQALAQGLAAGLTQVDPAQLSRRGAAVVAGLGPLVGTGHPVAIPAILAPALEPLSCRLSSQELVELLKQPTWTGLARRVVLDQLENRYRRQFADQWAFIRFAQEEHLGLDFTSPPKRPDFLLQATRK
jgi:hypothetical protein